MSTARHRAWRASPDRSEIERRGPHACLTQGGDLIGHQRQQRRHDQAHAQTLSPPDKRGNLIAQRLAAPGRHQHEGVAAADDVVDNARLRPAKGVVAVNIFQNVERGRHDGASGGYKGRASVQLW